MKGFLEWFKSGTKMKRWMFLILFGIVLTCYGMAEVIVLKEITFSEVAKIICVFVIGFTLIVLGLIHTQKRTLEVLIEASDKRMNDKNNVNMKSLIFNKKVYNFGPKIIVIGGGSGLNTVLQGLREYTDNITGIVAVSDYGNVPTNSRKELNLYPSDDIKESIISLAENREDMSKLLNYEFERGKLSGLSFGDVYLSAIENIYDNASESIRQSERVLNITGKVIPVTLDEFRICAELEDGTVIDKKENIPEVVQDKVSKINRVYLSPSNCRVSESAIKEIKEADAIIIGPGSLYTNVIPNLLINGISKEIKESKAIKIYVSNIMTESGQTDNYGISDHINAIIDHVGEGIIDYCICDTGEVIPEFIKKYNKEGSDLVEQDLGKVKLKGIKILQRNLSYINQDYIRHNPSAVAVSVIELICDDLSYQDKQNDPTYLMLNAKLKHDKQILKESKVRSKLKEKAPKEKHARSKFHEKYKDRIDSIKQSDEKQKQRQKQEIKKTRKTTTKNKLNQEENMPKRSKKQLDKEELERKQREIAELVDKLRR